MNHQQQILWNQFGGAIDMLTAAIEACPDTLWDDPAESAWTGFWYNAFHCLWFLDCYLSGTDADFQTPEPFTESEKDPEGALPPRTYTKAELLTYAAHGRRKCKATIEGLTEELGRTRCVSPREEMTFDELMLYNLRHVQHHAAQLNHMLRVATDSAPRWIGRARPS